MPTRIACPLLLALLLVAAITPMAAHAGESTSLPTYISTPSGFMHTEDHYLPGVTHAELGWKVGTPKSPCIQAQSIAARTYVLRWLNAKGHTKTIPALGPTFQAWTSKYSSASKTSSLSVKGQVMTYTGLVIYSNYSSGAYRLNSVGMPYAPSTYGYPTGTSWDEIEALYEGRKTGATSYSTWTSKVTSYNAWAWTQILVTFNYGKSGSAVKPTIHVSDGVRNRGGLGQWRAYWLDTVKKWDYVKILKSFYGSDITVVGASTSGGGTTPAAKPDLTVTGLSVSDGSSKVDYLAVGRSAKLQATIKNTGAGATGSTPIVVRFKVAGSVVGYATSTSSLGAGKSRTLTIDSGSWKPGAPGTYSVSAWADSSKAIAETSESNNVKTLTMRAHQVVTVTAGALNVRTGPSTGYAKTGLVYKHQRYVVRARSGSWYQLYLRGGVTAWFHGGYLTKHTSSIDVVGITASTLNVRTGPSTGYSKKGTTSSGQWYVPAGSSGSWQKLYWDGTTGWVSGSSTSYSVRVDP